MALTNDPKFGQMGSAAITKSHKLASYTVATLPSPAAHANRLIAVSNGNAGAPCLAYSNGTAWLRIIPGTAVSVT
jgi:beta-xylosidase